MNKMKMKMIRKTNTEMKNSDSGDRMAFGSQPPKSLPYHALQVRNPPLCVSYSVSGLLR